MTTVGTRDEARTHRQRARFGNFGAPRTLPQDARYSSDEHVRPVGPDMTTATPLGPPRAQTAQEQHAGLLELDAQPSVASTRLPEGAAPKVSAPAQGAASSYTDTYAASGPEPGTWKDPDPRRRSNRGSGAQNRPACAATAATRRLRAVRSQRLPGAMVSGAPAVL